VATVRGSKLVSPVPTAKGTPATPVRVPTTADLDLAKEDALLQLRIGRSAHYYTILVALALLFDAGLVLFFPPNAAGASGFRQSYFVLFPLVGGIFLALFGLRVKWEAYQLWPWELHFSVSIGAVGFNGVLGYLYIAHLGRFGPTAAWALLPWFYPLAVAGLAAALIGLALTWSEWTGRKTASIAASGVPIALAALASYPSLGAASVTSALALSLTAGSVLFLIAGSLLHIISSGTRTHEREVITSGQSRIFQAAEDVRRREEALRFREATVLKREADAEDAEASLRRQRESVEASRTQADEAEADLGKRAETLQSEERTWAERAVQVNSLHRAAQDKESDVALREADVGARAQKAAEREQALLLKEGEHRQREVDLAQREAELQRRQQGIPESEADLVRRRQELDRRTAELLQRESQIRTRETGAPATGATLAASGPPSAGGVEEREARLAQLKITLDEQNITLGRRARQVEEATKDILRREGELAKREVGVTAREGALTQRESDASERFDLGERRRGDYDEAVRRYQDRLQEADRKEAELTARRSEVDRATAALQQREAQTKERESQIGIQRTSLDRLQRVLAERQKSLEAREDELALRAQSRPPGGPVGAGSAVLPAGELLAAAPATHHPDRAPTGTPRLDDLLEGGIPPKGHVLLLGDAFVGTEVVLYGFLAEGLKRGEPAIIVTASRSPDEVAQGIGLVAPQFHEYEQLGKVSWIDASQPAGSPKTAPANGRKVTSVKGPDDHAGILSALVAAAKAAEASGAPGMRVGFLNLSGALAHGDEKAAAVFLQNFVGILKPRAALALYTLQSGALPDGQVERILVRMDGAIRFKQDGDKTLLQVAGLGEVQTREWIEYRATNRALVIGSFSLERIR
jgi:KaiC/GvpD/RAD55 family RecA-like ATPase